MKTITALICAGLLCGCTTTVNFALINSRSPAMNALGTNTLSAANGYSGGGTFTPETTFTPTGK